MSDRLELNVFDFLIEGRDEAKSHVLMELAKPAPEELSSHGHFLALAELGGASPKTIQLVRAWMEFAIESYYSSTPADTESHFENILNQLNTQSSLYLRQHANENIQMLVAVVCGTTLYMAFHGKPAALLLFRKNELWQSMDLSEASTEQPTGQLFGNIVSGTLRPDDRLLLATPRVVEFFTPDRLVKIAEGKTLEEVTDHMERVITELSSDYSFAGAWLKLVRIIENESIPAPVPAQAAPGVITHEKRPNSSMADLMQKTRDTATLLAPPVISIPKDKIITSILKLAQSGIVQGGRLCLVATRNSVSFVRIQGGKIAANQISPRLKSITSSVPNFANEHQPSMRRAPQNSLKYAAIGVAVLVLVGGGLGYAKYRAVKEQKNADTITMTTDKISAADQAFTYQNESAARDLIGEAEVAFKSLSTSEQKTVEAAAVSVSLQNSKNKILHIIVVQPEQIPEITGVRDVIYAAGSPIYLAENGHVKSVKNGKPVDLGASTDGAGDRLFLDEQNNRVIVGTGTGMHFSAIPVGAGKAVDITVANLPEHTQVDAAVFYSGRAYLYTNATQMIYRYDKTDTGYGSGKKWITDPAKPTGIVSLVADTSVWMLTGQGAILKFTSGKLQPFHFSGMIPDMGPVSALSTVGSGNSVYFLDNNNARIVVTDRDGKLARQYVMPSGTILKTFAVDKNETAAVGLTNDNKLVRFDLAK